MAVEFETGLTWRVLLAILSVSVFFTPLAIYLGLTGGSALGGAAVYITAILFSEFSRMFGTPLKRQELYVIYRGAQSISGIGMGALGVLVYRAYFVTTDVTYSYQMQGVSIPYLVPAFLAPPPGTYVYQTRNLFASPWLMPILVGASMTLLSFLVEISLVMICSMLYIEVERLPFPFVAPDVALATTLSEREPSTLRYFFLGFIPGAIYGSFVYALPLLIGVQLIPIPWVDFTIYTEPVLPGALIGIATDIERFVMGFLLPTNMTACMLISSLAIYIFGNFLTLTTFTSFAPEWRAEYFTGMGLANALARSSYRVWYSPHVGFLLAIVIIVIMKTRKAIFSAFGALRRISGAGTVSFSIPIIVSLYLIGTLGQVLMFYYLVPDFRSWIFIPAALTIGFSFFSAITSTRTVGEAGSAIGAEALWQPIVYMTGYQGYTAWVFYPTIAGVIKPSFGGAAHGAAATMMNHVMGAYLTRTKPMDIIKMFIIITLVGNIFGFIYASFFWTIAPIPSSVYPNALINMPIQAIGECLLMTRQIKVDPLVILGSLAAMLAACSIGETLRIFAGIPFSSIGFYLGTTAVSIPPYVVPLFIGSLIGRCLIQRQMGRRWFEVRGIIVAGILAGQGIFVGVAVAAALVAKATWIWVY